MCLVIKNHLEMRSRKSWQLVAPNFQQFSKVAPPIFNNFCKNYCKARDPGDEVENEVNNTEIFVNFLLFCKLSSGLGFNARMLCNFVSRSFPLFDMQKYWFCRVLPHVNQPKTSRKEISKLFLSLRSRRNNEKLKLLSRNKTHVHSILVTFDVLRLYVVTEKNLKIYVCSISYSDSLKT